MVIATLDSCAVILIFIQLNKGIWVGNATWLLGNQQVEYSHSCYPYDSSSYCLHFSHIESGDLSNAFSLWVVIDVFETISFKCVDFHFMVIECADGVNVWLCGKLLEELLGIVEIEHFLDAVEVLSNVVLVGVNAKWLVNLILHYYVFMHKDDFNLIIIY